MNALHRTNAIHQNKNKNTPYPIHNTQFSRLFRKSSGGRSPYEDWSASAETEVVSWKEKVKNLRSHQTTQKLCEQRRFQKGMWPIAKKNSTCSLKHFSSMKFACCARREGRRQVPRASTCPLQCLHPQGVRRSVCWRVYLPRRTWHRQPALNGGCDEFSLAVALFQTLFLVWLETTAKYCY